MTDKRINGDYATTLPERMLSARCDELKAQRDYYRRELKKARVYLVALTLCMVVWATLFAAPADWTWPSDLRGLFPPIKQVGIFILAGVWLLITALVLAPTRKEWE